MASDAQAGDLFGVNVSITADQAIVGAYNEDAAGSKAGAANILEKRGGSWSAPAKLQASDAQANDLFGLSVSIDGDQAIVGARHEDTGGSNSGAAYVFEKSGGTWSEVNKLEASAAQANDQFGRKVSIDGNQIILVTCNGYDFISDKFDITLSGIPIPGKKNDNLIVKAYQLLKEKYDVPPVNIQLHIGY